MVADFLGELIGGLVGGGLWERGRRRRLARADAAGGRMEFPGSVLGSAPYCHPAGGMLRVEGPTLTWLTSKGGMAFPVPVDRLDVRALGDVRPSEAFGGGRNVAVVCDDAGRAVRIIVLASDLPYLARALPGVGRYVPAAGVS